LAPVPTGALNPPPLSLGPVSEARTTLQLPRTLKGRLDILACPSCGGALEAGRASLVCAHCRTDYPVENGKIYFTRPPAHGTAASDIKHWLRLALGSRYNRVVRTVGPGFPVNKWKLLTENIDPTRNLVVDLGSGTERIHPDLITLDLFDYPEVDIVCDLRALPFREGSLDAFMTTSVLEHIDDVPALVDRILACTRDGGIGIHSFPFLFPFHESPYDFVRYTHMGAEVLFKKWKIRRLFNAAGPITVFNTMIIEFLSSLLSMGSGRAKEAIYLGLSLCLFPLKYLDLFFVNRPRFLSISAVLCVVAEKPSADVARTTSRSVPETYKIPQ
jgi:SAM-dependent methyltransferase